MGQGTRRIVVPLFVPSVHPLTGIPWRCRRRAALPEVWIFLELGLPVCVPLGAGMEGIAQVWG